MFRTKKIKKEHDEKNPTYKDGKRDCVVPSEDKSNLLICRKKRFVRYFICFNV